MSKVIREDEAADPWIRALNSGFSATPTEGLGWNERSKVKNISAQEMVLRKEDVEEKGDKAGLDVTLGDLDVLDCPICTEPLTPPVFQCDDGHLACELCCNFKRKRCPCSMPIFVRNRAIERVVQSAKTSCRNMFYGCKEKVSYLGKSEHEKTCNYAPIRCPLRECNYAGKTNCFYTHFRDEHKKSFLPFSFGKAELIFMGKDEDHMFLQESAEDILFVLNRFSDPRGSLINVTCLAQRTSDMKFSYDLAAVAGERSINVKTLVELTPELNIQPPGEDCLLITNAFHAEDNGISSSNSALLITTLGIRLTIQKLTC